MMNQFDYLVIGSGIAGLSYALKVAPFGRVAIVTKRGLRDCNTYFAQGGIASVTETSDSFEQHIEDTLSAGDDLCKKDVVEAIVKHAPEDIAELGKYGVKFAKKGKHLTTTREGGHSQKRILHTQDATGRSIQDALISQVKNTENITLFEHHIAIDLITNKKLSSKPRRCIGAYILDIATNEIITFQSHVTLLSTGGAGKVYVYTSNPDVASGDGIAMAYRLGCRVANLEFVQFHPTCLFHPQAKSFLLSEALRGEGALLRRKDGTLFMKDHDPRAELATRDIVARAIDFEMKKSGDECVYLDLTHLKAKKIKDRFPTIYATCKGFGFDPCHSPLPVVPAAHYFCGGVVTNIHGETDVAGLYACGEVACTGMHGANRLASNSLLEGAVVSHFAAQKSISFVQEVKMETFPIPDWNSEGTSDNDEEVVITQNWDEVRRLMWNYVGIVRSNKRLDRAKKRINLLREEIREYYWNFKLTNNLIELRNLALVADLIIRSACQRKESRGLHFNLDYPEKRESEKKDTVLQRAPRKK
ncbi:MAG: L-aspartate oxidase [Deltaproteobacteria bacterium CG11_big_fil_rev_8_21_14_0_20_42_23]|nr:MAG: L-aspartate oxidase [Deltaproteobacteria bacterium CG11_big_fil_rev_8_21_14_0_20_42_23]PJC63764.1 MAG: L-aspartate oxidase [Deltaproteobacteria bacterium CG_4_9_14_0_2_um_filter_42_21]